MNHRKIQLLRQLHWLYLRLLALRLRQQIVTGKMESGEALAILAASAVGIDVSPNDVAPDELGCSESVSELINLLIPFKIQTFTGYLNDQLISDKRVKGVIIVFRPGDIVISPTPFPGSPKIGHTAIIGRGGKWYSNSSYSGVWEQNYDYLSWRERYQKKLGLPLNVFRLT